MFPRYRDMTTRPAGNDISSKTGSNFLHSCISTFTVDVWFASTLVFTISFRKFNCNLGNLFLLFWVLDPTEKGFFFFFTIEKFGGGIQTLTSFFLPLHLASAIISLSV